jgi:ATP-dependent helicase/nuclease subunit A
MEQLLIDSAAREEALNPNSSYLVQAPAGSGKTALLTQRLLVLLANAKQNPEEILSITFTRKAAAEMKTRVLEALERAEDLNPPLAPHEAKLWQLARQVLVRDQQLGWNLLSAPNRLKIQTIDAFCLGLTSQMPIVSQCGLALKVTLDASLHYQMAARRTLEHLANEDAWGDAVATILQHLDNHWLRVEQLLADMLAKRDQWLPYIGLTSQHEDLRAQLELGLREVVLARLRAVTASIPAELIDILPLAKAAGEFLYLANVASPIQACRHLTLMPGDLIEDLTIWQGLAALFLREDHEWRKSLTQQQGFPAQSYAHNATDKKYYQQLKLQMLDGLEALSQYPIFRENLQNLREAPPLHYTDAQWQLVRALKTLLPVATAELALVFQDAKELDFTEMTLSALRALGHSEEPTDLALNLDYKIQHILVDEFQDTSVSQFRLLEALTRGWQINDGRTLFLVGDPMQSIYRFRQAEVGLFIRAKEQAIGEITLKPLTLTANFRSSPLIVDWVNTAFQKKFPIHYNMGTGAVAFNRSTAVLANHALAKTVVSEVNGTTETATIIDFIRGSQKADPVGTMALLVRARTHLAAILPSLRAAEIAYEGIELEALLVRPVIQDLLALTRAVVHLGDRVAWLSVLRAPWCRLSLADLTILANHASHLPLWYTINNFMEVSLSDEGKASLVRIIPLLTTALVSFRRKPLRIVILELWQALGGLALYAVDALSEAEAFFAILDEDGQDFLALGVLEKRLQSLYAPTPKTTRNALQVMTIHRAKGLEFDTVIVPRVSRKTKSDGHSLLLWEESITQTSAYLILGPVEATATTDPLYRYLKRQESMRARYEAVRLEYVAATRARHRLLWLLEEEEQ